MSIELTRYAVPGWGVGELWTRDGVLVAHDFKFDDSSVGSAPEPSDNVLQAAPPAPRGPQSPSNKLSQGLASDLARRFGAFLAGGADDFRDVAIDLEWATPFQQALATTLRAVPRGEVVTYGELAALAGRPRAARAAGTFCAENRFALVIPCHRVVSASGIGGYGPAGVEIKRRLLALEGVRL